MKSCRGKSNHCDEKDLMSLIKIKIGDHRYGYTRFFLGYSHVFAAGPELFEWPSLTEIFSDAKIRKFLLQFFFLPRFFFLAQDFFPCSKKNVARKEILRQEKKYFVTVSRRISLASEIISVGVWLSWSIANPHRDQSKWGSWGGKNDKKKMSV